MARILWILLMLWPLAKAQSGGGDEESRIICYSHLTLTQNNLSCNLNDDPLEDIEFIRLCGILQCYNGTVQEDFLKFTNLNILDTLNLTVYFKGGDAISQLINLRKIVKLAAPVVENATYSQDSDTAQIHIRNFHDYVKEPNVEFQVNIKSFSNTQTFKMKVETLTISAEYLNNDKEYEVKARARPVGTYWGGLWSAWSHPRSFTVENANQQRSDLQGPVNIVLIIAAVLLLVIGMATLWWQKVIKAYMSPSIPHPKTSLSHVQKTREGLSVFSPEIFNDIYIHLVAYDSESQPPAGIQEAIEVPSVQSQRPSIASRLSHRQSLRSVAGCGGSCPSLLCKQPEAETLIAQAEDSTPRLQCLDAPISSAGGTNVSARLSLRVSKAECKDEDYVTMSSLYKLH